MHDVSRGVERGDVVLQDIKVKSWSQQPPLTRPLLPVAYQQTLSWDVKRERERFGGEDDSLKAPEQSFEYLTHQAKDADAHR